jgi:serine/threonine protein phosphatase PrpC
MSPLALMTELRKATCAANDVISDRNDHEERRDRERMGTTLVMGLVQNHELYITHVGDSRAYLITKAECHQVTLDDDVASREARLGYGTYRSALIHPGSGSLVQALGMGPSGSLHPTVQRFVLEGEGVMLLCSDGLSDNDLVNGLWQNYLLPLLDTRDSVDLAAIANKLVNAANQYNGHDNVTVSLVRWVVQHPSKFKIDPKLATPPTLTSSIPGLSSKTRMQPASSTGVQESPVAHDASPTKLIAPNNGDNGSSAQSTSSPSVLGVRSLVSLLLGILFLLSLGGVLAYVLLPSVSDRIDAWLGIDGQSYSSTPTSLDSDEEGSLNSADAEGDNRLELPLQIGSIVQISRTDLTDEGDRSPADSSSEQTPEPTILRLYPEPSFSVTPSAGSALETPGEPEGGDRSPSSGTSPSISSPASPEATSAASSDASASTGALPPSLPSSDGTDGESIESVGSPVNTVAAPTPVTAGTMLRVVGQQEGEGNVRWIRLRVCHVPVKPDEAIVSGETQEPIAGIDSGENVLAAGEAGWMPEHQIVTVAVLSPRPDETQLQGCQLSVAP